MNALADGLVGQVPPATRTERIQAITEIKTETQQERREQVSVTAAADPPSKLELGEALREVRTDELVVDEGVTAGFLIRNQLDFDPGEFLAIKSGGLGYGLPAAVGAAIAEENRENTRDVIGLVGDGAFQYYPQALYTAARYVDSALSVLVVDNSGYGILREAHKQTHDREHSPDELSFDPPVDSTAIGAGYGVKARQADITDDLGQQVSWAVDTAEPTVLNVPVSE